MPHSYLYITNNLETAIARARHTIACTGQTITVGDFVIATNQRFDPDTEKHEKPALTVEATRGIIREAHIVPTGSIKAILIPDADLMLHQAQNALLKILEEPPESVVFFLVARNEKALLPTIKSRVETIYLQETEQELNPELHSKIEKLVAKLDTPVEKYRAMSALIEFKDEKSEVLDVLEKIFSLQNVSGNDIVERAKMQQKISFARQQLKSNCNWNGIIWGLLS